MSSVSATARGSRWCWQERILPRLKSRSPVSLPGTERYTESPTVLANTQYRNILLVQLVIRIVFIVVKRLMACF